MNTPLLGSVAGVSAVRGTHVARLLRTALDEPDGKSAFPRPRLCQDVFSKAGHFLKFYSEVFFKFGEIFIWQAELNDELRQ